MSGASKKANERVSSPILTSRFLDVLNHYVMVFLIRESSTFFVMVVIIAILEVIVIIVIVTLYLIDGLRCH